MRVDFSPHLDSLDPAPPTTSIGEISVGPQGLLRLLESDLGLPPLLAHPAELIVAYRGCLAELDSAQRFYHRSFAVDPLSVARSLNDWRSRWYEAGWDGTFAASVPPRLRDMAEVERIAAARVPLCRGQRVARALVALEDRRTQIERIVLREEPSALPYVWRRLLERVGFEVAAGVAPAVSAPVGSDLARVQALLIEGIRGGAAEPLSLAQDGSFVIVRAASRDISARAIGETLRAESTLADTVIIAEHDGIIVDNALERSGLPRCGFQHFSRFRAVSQALKLCLALLWEPVNPHLLLQFFIHPLAPVRLVVRRALAAAVAAEPGIGGRAWNQAIDDLEARLAEAGESRARIESVRATVAEWFEGERFDPVAGAPFAALSARAQRCRSWLSSRLSLVDDPGERAMYGSALAQAETLISALKALADQGRTSLGRIELERLVDEVSLEQPDPEIFAEAGRARASTHPASVTGSWRQVIWWDLAATAQDLADPWAAEELGALDAAGVDLPQADARLDARTRGWLRPILNCRERCILVVHRRDEGQHPLWSQLENLLENRAELDLESALLEEAESALPLLEVDTAPVDVRPLPAPRRWWHLPDGTALPPREEESYSSLSKLFHYPHEWVLNYRARLRTGRAEDLADGPRLYGTLAHRLFEAFFTHHESWRDLDSNAVRDWLDAALPQLVREEGAVLLEPGRGVDHEQVSAVLERALLRLLEHLESADIVRVRAEHPEAAPYGRNGPGLRGVLDLLLTRADGSEVVVDAKWGSEKFRGQELEHNAQLQLASYAYLRRAATGANEWPYQAYFIVTSGNMLAPDASVFPEARVFAPEDGADVAGLWRRGEQTYAWRRAQLDAGVIEVNAAGTQATEESIAPDDALDIAADPDRFDDYVRLTGWDEFS